MTVLLSLKSVAGRGFMEMMVVFHLCWNCSDMVRTQSDHCV